MKKTTLLLIFVVIVALLFSAWKAYDGIYFEKNKQSVIKCHYMAYACGDCYPQWNIDSSFAVANSLKELIEKDIYVNYKGKEVEESIPDSVDKCIICYDFYFTGTLKKTLSDKYKFEVENFKMELRFPDCCNQ